MIKQFINNIFSKKNYLIFCLLYTFFRFLLDNRNERITQFLFFTVSILYLLSILYDDYKRFLNKDFIISYLIILFAIISVLANKKIDFISIRAILMLIINFIALIIDDPYDKNYKNTFNIIVNLILALCLIHNILCLILMITDILNLTNTGVFFIGRLKGFTYFSGTGELGLIGLGSSIYYFENNKEKKDNVNFIITCILLFIINIATIVLAQSRCSLYSMVLCILIYMTLKILIEGKKDLILSLAKVLFLFFMFTIILYLVLYKLEIFKIRNFSLASIERLNIWYAYLMVLIRENFLFGLGPTKFVYIFRVFFSSMSLLEYNSYFGNINIAEKVFNQKLFFEELLPHNEYIRHALLFGFVGLMLLFVFIFSVIYKIFKIIISKDIRFLSLCYLFIFYFIFPLISGLVENMLSFSNSPRYIENFTLFFITGYIYKSYYIIKELRH